MSSSCLNCTALCPSTHLSGPPSFFFQVFSLLLVKVSPCVSWYFVWSSLDLIHFPQVLPCGAMAPPGHVQEVVSGPLPGHRKCPSSGIFHIFFHFCTRPFKPFFSDTTLSLSIGITPFLFLSSPQGTPTRLPQDPTPGPSPGLT